MSQPVARLVKDEDAGEVGLDRPAGDEHLFVHNINRYHYLAILLNISEH